MADYSNLFNGTNDDLSILDDKKKINNDGLFRPDMSKVKDPSVGYKVTLRFLPNFTKDLKREQPILEKITHYVNTPDMPELRGYYDSPKNFEEKCDLSDLFYKLDSSKNAVIQAKAKSLNWSRKYFSYVLVIDDTVDPTNNGKIFIFSYGKTIYDKIKAEKNGENPENETCNIFALEDGKDFQLIVKELNTGTNVFPDYKSSLFKTRTSIPLFDNGKSKRVPLNEDGKIDAKHQPKVIEFLLDREVNLEDFSPKRLNDEQKAKIQNIISYLTGTLAAKSTNTNDYSELGSDFNLNDTPKTDTVGAFSMDSDSDDDDDFFNDL